MNKISSILFIISIATFLSCKEEFDKYQKPDWLKGKLYSQIESTPDLDSFAVCLKISGMDTIINTSGSFTVFAPDNEAFIEYLLNNPAYKRISDIPKKVLTDLVKYHIVQNSWTGNQLQQLDIYGWIDPKDPNNDQPRGYKRQTLMYQPNKKYWVKEIKGEVTIVDSTLSNDYRVIFSPSRKYVPIFFDAFLKSAEIDPPDYEYYFNKSYDPGNIYFAGAKVISHEIYAENGIVYQVDKVVEPLLNGEELLSSQKNGHDYSEYLSLLHYFGTVTYNSEETEKLPGYAEGLEVDYLYDLHYPKLVFDAHSELTGPGTTNSIYTIRYQYGLVAPTNDALQELYDNVITSNSGYPHWGSASEIPDNVKRIIVESHMSSEPVYLSNLDKGFVNGEKDMVLLDPSVVIQKSYGSNCTFLGIKHAIVPRAFSSVTGPVYLRPGFSVYRQAMEITNILAAVKRKNANYSFFIIPDEIIRFDSSLMAQYIDERRFFMQSFSRSDLRLIKRTTNDLTIQLLNQVGTRTPSGIPKKEFIPNLAGNFIVYESDNGLVSGGVSSKFGYSGDSVIEIHPVVLDEPADNGKCYSVNGWFSFPRTDLYSTLQGFSGFFNLLKKAGLVDNVFYKLKFISPGEFYTVIVPSDSAIQSINTDTLSTVELAQFLKYHFIKGALIFTDGVATPGNYETLRIDESSTLYNSKYSVLNINPGTDKIDILDQNGSTLYSIKESDEKTNLMTAVDIDDDPVSVNYVITAIVHKINTVLLK